MFGGKLSEGMSGSIRWEKISRGVRVNVPEKYLETRNIRRNVHIPLQDYKCLCAVVMICDTLVNTHTHTHRQLLSGGTKIITHVGIWLGNNRDNFQLHRFTTSENIPLSFRDYFFCLTL